MAAELQSTDDVKRLTDVIISHLADAAGATSASLSVVVEDGRGGSNYGLIDVAAGSNPDVVVGTPPGARLIAIRLNAPRMS